MPEITKEQVIDYLSNLTVMDIAALTKTLEEKWGVKAAPVAVGMAMAAGPAAAAAAEPTEFNVILTGCGDKKTSRSSKALRESHQPRTEGGQGGRRGRAQGDQGIGQQGRVRDGQEEDGGGWRDGGDQAGIVTERHKLDHGCQAPGSFPGPWHRSVCNIWVSPAQRRGTAGG